MGAKYDFSGWATRNDILCSDGRTIRKNAFIDCDGTTVPLVWNHQHNDPENVLGHALLENRDEGVYAYCSFNKNPRGQHGKEMVKNGDITSLSIFANHLKQYGGDVVHGAIREVSLVLAGANPGAFIDSVMVHGELSDEEAYIFNDMEGLELFHDDSDENYEGEVETMPNMNDVLGTLTEDQMNAVYELVGQALENEGAMSHSMESTLGTLNEDQMNAVYELVGQALEQQEYELSHADEEDDETVADVFNTMTKKQKTVVYALIGKAIEDAKGGSAKHSDDDNEYLYHAAAEGEETVADVFNTLNEKQKKVAYALIGQAIEDAKNTNDEDEDESEGEEMMKHNAFESNYNDDYEVLSHADTQAIFSDAQRCGSLRDAVLAHGIENIEYLFPDAQSIDKTPAFISERSEWVNVVMNGVRHTPFARIKSIFADITVEDARAKGYVKGNRKLDEVITLLKRVTLPITIYKKQKIDRDDIIDVIDFDMVAWLKGEMRTKLDEEIARAILISDGRNPLAEDKINEQNVRPIWTDDPLYTINATVNVDAAATPDDKAKAFIRAAVKARKEYKGSGNCVCFTSEDMLTDCLLMEDTIGHVIYDTQDKLATALRVKKIVSVPYFDNLTRNVNGATRYLGGLIVDLGDYNVGADKGGAVNMFDDFDIDFNQQKYLIETRISGALIKPYSAIAVELIYALTLSVAGEDPANTILGKQVSELQSGILVNDSFISGTLHYVTGYTGYSGNPELQSGNFLALKFEATDDATTTLELIGGVGGVVTLDSDMNAVVRITNKATQKIRVVTTKDGQSLTKTYGLRMLVCETE